MEDLQITQDEVEIKLSKHFINKETFNAMLQERYIDFLVSRADEVCNFFEGIGVTMVRTKDALAEEIECDDDFELTDEEE